MHVRSLRVLLVSTKKRTTTPGSPMNPTEKVSATAAQKRDAAAFDRVCAEGKRLKPPTKRSKP